VLAHAGSRTVLIHYATLDQSDVAAIRHLTARNAKSVLLVSPSAKHLPAMTTPLLPLARENAALSTSWDDRVAAWNDSAQADQLCRPRRDRPPDPLSGARGSKDRGAVVLLHRCRGCLPPHTVVATSFGGCHPCHATDIVLAMHAYAQFPLGSPSGLAGRTGARRPVTAMVADRYDVLSFVASGSVGEVWLA
jgi:hypothetical protein